MDPPADINASVIDRTALQTALSGLPPPGASTELGPSRALLCLSTIIPLLRPLFTPLGINLDMLIREKTKNNFQQEAPAEVEAAPEPAFECPICMGAYVRPTAVKVCGHVFCAACLAESIAKYKKCPTCQAKATKRHLLRVFL